MRFDIGKAKASRLREGFLPNPRLKLLDQVNEVMRFRHYSLRIERTCQEWIRPPAIGSFTAPVTRAGPAGVSP